MRAGGELRRCRFNPRLPSRFLVRTQLPVRLTNLQLLLGEMTSAYIAVDSISSREPRSRYLDTDFCRSQSQSQHLLLLLLRVHIQVQNHVHKHQSRELVPADPAIHTCDLQIWRRRTTKAKRTRIRDTHTQAGGRRVAGAYVLSLKSSSSTRRCGSAIAPGDKRTAGADRSPEGSEVTRKDR